MTDTAKQDTTKTPAEPAATESAATQADAPAEPETAADTVLADTVLADPVAAEADEGAVPDLDETKRKFREALDRKRQAHTDGQGKGGQEGGKVSGAHGPAASRRNFRRKSG